MKRRKGLVIGVFQSVIYIHTVGLTRKNSVTVLLSLRSRLVHNGLDVVFNPEDVTNALVLQGLGAIEESLLVVKLVLQGYFIFFATHGLVMELQWFRCFLSWCDFIVELKVVHLFCDQLIVPVEDVLLVHAQVLRLWADKPQRIKQQAQYQGDWDARTCCVEGVLELIISIGVLFPDL